MKECPKCGQWVLEAQKTCDEFYGGCGHKLRNVPFSESLREDWETFGFLFWIAADLALLYGLVRFVHWAWY